MLQRLVVRATVLFLSLLPGRRLKAWAAHTVEWIYDEVHEWKYDDPDYQSEWLALDQVWEASADFGRQAKGNVVPISSHPKFKSVEIEEEE